AAEGGGDDLLRAGGLGSDVAADRHGPFDDVVGQPSEALHLDLHHVARLDRPGVGGGAGQQHIARVEGDRTGDVGDEVVHVPLHLVGGAVLGDLAVDVGADPLAVEIPVVDQAGTERAQRVGALDPQHRSGVGVAEVVQPVVVGDGVPG